MLTFRLEYFIFTLLLFITEVLIALYAHDEIIRPYIGDMLVVVLIYCFVRSFFRWQALPVAIGVLIFSFAVETLQYFRIVEVLGLQDSAFFRIIIGTTFVWMDLAMYALGIALVIFIERLKPKKHYPLK
ncbi:DUF2809 domain-containing protein [uncultured Flavobacterium sp.]|uniref:ribosomal maturation YjgA family protein n=1 Tax=uncultured Flavobacterium sp. TaxID=165435 RepID=UPI0025CEFCC0|nr:DUF2809 domain-containing protein [uncultured Flavobacterium sp.]